MSFLPQGLGTEAWIIYTALYFLLGALVGWAVKKALIAAVMIIIAAVVAVFILGLSIAIDMGALALAAGNRIADFYSTYGLPLSSYPIAFGLGVFLGFWKGR